MLNHFPGSEIFENVTLEDSQTHTDVPIPADSIRATMRAIRSRLSPLRKNLLRIGAMTLLPFRHTTATYDLSNGFQPSEEGSFFVFKPNHSQSQVVLCGLSSESWTPCRRARGDDCTGTETHTINTFVPTFLTAAAGIISFQLEARMGSANVFTNPEMSSRRFTLSESGRDICRGFVVQPRRRVLGVDCGNIGGRPQGLMSGCTRQRLNQVTTDWGGRNPTTQPLPHVEVTCDRNDAPDAWLTSPGGNFRVWSVTEIATETLSNLDSVIDQQTRVLSAESDSALLRRFSVYIAAVQADHRQVFAATVAAGFRNPSGDLLADLNALDLNYRLILSFLGYVYPESIHSNAALRTALFGREGMLSADQFKDIMQQGVEPVMGASGRTQASRTGIEQRLAVTERLQRALRAPAIQSASRSPQFEPIPTVHAMIRRLRLVEQDLLARPAH